MSCTHEHQDVDQCYIDRNAYGGYGGESFSKCLITEGATVKTITAYLGRNALNGIKVTYTNGDILCKGNLEKPAEELSYTLEDEETLKDICVYHSDIEIDNVVEHRCGGFQLKSNNGRSFDAVVKVIVDQGYPMGFMHFSFVGSGVLCGVFGASNNFEINRLGFACLEEVKHVDLRNVKYPDLEECPIDATPIEANTVNYNNQSSQPQTFALSGSTEIEEKSTGSITIPGLSPSMRARVPFVSGMKAGWKPGMERSFNDCTIYKQRTVQYNYSITAAPCKQTIATALMYQDHIKTKYTGTLVLKLKNGQILNFPVEGVYSGLSTREMYVNISEDDVTEIL